MEPIKLDAHSVWLNLEAIITRLNELSEMMQPTLAQKEEKMSRTKFDGIRVGFNHYGMPTLIFNSDKDAQAALKLLTDNTN